MRFLIVVYDDGSYLHWFLLSVGYISDCYRMDEGFRPRSNQGIIEEVKLLKKNTGLPILSSMTDY